MSFYEANRDLIRWYRESHRQLVANLNEQYRMRHELLLAEYSDEVIDGWV